MGMSKMSRLLYGYAAMLGAAMNDTNVYDTGYSDNTMNNYKVAKMGGCTPVKGRKHLSKKQRKKLQGRISKSV